MSELYESAQKVLAAAGLSDALKDQRLLDPDTLEGALQAAFCDGWKRAREHVCPECAVPVPMHALSCSEVAARGADEGEREGWKRAEKERRAATRQRRKRRGAEAALAMFKDRLIVAEREITILRERAERAEAERD